MHLPKSAYWHASECMVSFAVLSGTPGSTLVYMSIPSARKIMERERGESAFLCGGGDDWCLDKGELDGSQQKRGE